MTGDSVSGRDSSSSDDSSSDDAPEQPVNVTRSTRQSVRRLVTSSASVVGRTASSIVDEVTDAPSKHSHRRLFWYAVVIIVLVNTANLLWCILKYIRRVTVIGASGLEYPDEFPPVYVVACPSYDFRWAKVRDVEWGKWLSFLRTEGTETKRTDYGNGVPVANIKRVTELEQLQNVLGDGLVLEEDFEIEGKDYDNNGTLLFPKGWSLIPCEGCSWTKQTLLDDIDVSDVNSSNETSWVPVSFRVDPPLDFKIFKVILAGIAVDCAAQRLPPMARSDAKYEFIDLSFWDDTSEFNSIYLAFADLSQHNGTLDRFHRNFADLSKVQMWAGQKMHLGLKASKYNFASGSSIHDYDVMYQEAVDKGGRENWCNPTHFCLHFANGNLNYQVQTYDETFSYTRQDMISQILSVFSFTFASVLAVIFPVRTFVTDGASTRICPQRRILLLTDSEYK